MTALREAFSQERREWLVREVLVTSQDVRHGELGRRLGVSRETVRRVRYGLMWREIAPELPRLSRDVVDASCKNCRLFDQKRMLCAMDYPEATHEDGSANLRYAQQCPAWFAVQDDVREAHVAQIRLMGAAKMSQRAIAREVGCSREFVRATLRSGEP